MSVDHLQGERAQLRDQVAFVQQSMRQTVAATDAAQTESAHLRDEVTFVRQLTRETRAETAVLRQEIQNIDYVQLIEDQLQRIRHLRLELGAPDGA